jgi:hypothetical protein
MMPGASCDVAEHPRVVRVCKRLHSIRDILGRGVIEELRETIDAKT